MTEEGVGAALIVLKGGLVFAEEKGVDVGYRSVIVEASVVEVTAVVGGAVFVVGSGNTDMVVGFTAVVVEASFVEDRAVVARATFSVAGGAVVGSGNTGMVVGFIALVVKVSFVVDNGVVGAAFAVILVSDDI